MTRFLTLLTAGLIATTASLSTASAGIVTNGGFDTSFATPGKRNSGQTFDKLNTGPGASWNVWDAIPGWTADSGYGIEIQSDRTLGSIDAHSGQYYVELDSNNNSSMFQDVLLKTGKYALSFFFSPRVSNVTTNGIDFGIDGLLASETVNGPGGTLGSSIGSWTEITRVFDVASDGTYRLRFGASGKNDSYGGLIDSVSINGGPSEGPAPVPLPAGILLLGSAAAGLAGMRRFRRS